MGRHDAVGSVGREAAILEQIGGAGGAPETAGQRSRRARRPSSGQVGIGVEGQHAPAAGDRCRVPPAIGHRLDLADPGVALGQRSPAMSPDADQPVAHQPLGAEAARQPRPPAACIDQDRHHQQALARGRGQPDLPSSRAGRHCRDGGRRQQLRAPGDRDGAQPAVEAGTIEMPARAVGVAQAVPLARHRAAPIGAKALARSVPLALEGLPQPHVGEQPCGHRRQRLADPRRRLRPALHHHRATQRCQVQRRRAAGRPGTDDEDLGRGHLSRAGPSGSVAPSRSPRDPAPCAPGRR